MNEAATKTPWHLWAVGIVTLLWNAFGCVIYTATQAGKAELNQEQQAYFDAVPAWSTSSWAIGVWFALLGSILLLLRKGSAVSVFVVSLLGLAGTAIYQLSVDVPESMQNYGLTATIWIFALFSIWYAIRMRNQGVLR